MDLSLVMCVLLNLRISFWIYSNSLLSPSADALINDLNEHENKKILTLEKPIEYKHKSNKAVIVQKEVGKGGDIDNFRDGVKNALREDCDILIIRRDKR
jgi:Tfp pilus assembly pilus retraction ATPase PilT